MATGAIIGGIAALTGAAVSGYTSYKSAKEQKKAAAAAAAAAEKASSTPAVMSTNAAAQQTTSTANVEQAVQEKAKRRHSVDSTVARFAGSGLRNTLN
ncbi:MAG: hypothetical protein IJN29_04705 [Akkermansia sp.]|nr:hypothetical protein [Akkermansia sp.]